MKFIVSADPTQDFDSAEDALRAATSILYLRPTLFGTYVDRLNRGLAVTWAYGFSELSVRPIRTDWDRAKAAAK